MSGGKHGEAGEGEPCCRAGGQTEGRDVRQTDSDEGGEDRMTDEEVSQQILDSLETGAASPQDILEGLAGKANQLMYMRVISRLAREGKVRWLERARVWQRVKEVKG